MAEPKQDQRKEWASKGLARPDGSWPIPNVAYLKKACLAFPGRAQGQEATIKRWIMKRANALNATGISEMDRVKNWSPGGGGGKLSESPLGLRLTGAQLGDLSLLESPDVDGDDVPSVKCPKCGRTGKPDDDGNCPNCGQDLSKIAAVAARMGS